MENSMLDALRAAEQVKPVVVLPNGTKIVSFEDMRAMAQSEIINGYDLGDRTTNADGSIAASRTPYAAVNLDNLFLNRYRKVKNTLQVVNDYRADPRAAYRQSVRKQIPAYVISRGEDGKLKMDKVVTISDTEFVAEFTHTLSNKAMTEIYPILSQGSPTVTADELTI